MDIAAMSTGLSQLNFQSQASTLVLRKAMDQQQQQASDMLSLLQSVAVPSPEPLGQSIDISA
ncbi:YjfB family protein [Azotosporobacter soli]|uniref:YjfB family protein n=1 Tax=Azotosporobacter soli TaxID=3055040 RepID=UPI0031FF2C13